MYRLLYVVYAHVLGDTDLNTVHGRLIHQLLTSAAGDCRDLRHCTMDGPPDPVAARRDAKAMNADGAWLDVNYSDKTRTGAWSPHIHLDRLVMVYVY